MTKLVNNFKYLLSVTIAASFLSAPSYATIFPLNNLNREDQPNRITAMTPEKFRALALRVSQLFSPVVSQHGGVLQFRLRWVDATVNAFAAREGAINGKPIWLVTMFGGLARRPEVTEDGFTLVMCHELGHHLAGYPFKSDDSSPSGARWAATEGESDYFASQVCAKKLWEREPAVNAQLAVAASDEVKFACRWNHPGSTPQAIAEQNLCYRVVNAGMSLATLLARLNDYIDPAMRGRNKTAVDETYEAHPEAQCRLDTYVAGALCKTPFDLRVIPGLIDGLPTNTPQAESMAMRYSCRQEARYDPRYAARYGARPLCWFKPKNPMIRR